MVNNTYHQREHQHLFADEGTLEITSDENRKA
jgi:hypothetical protein